jgi:hypothetical protein
MLVAPDLQKQSIYFQISSFNVKFTALVNGSASAPSRVCLLELIDQLGKGVDRRLEKGLYFSRRTKNKKRFWQALFVHVAEAQVASRVPLSSWRGSEIVSYFACGCRSTLWECPL